MNKNIFIKISVFLIILLYLGYFSLRYVYIYQNTPWFLNSPKTSRAVQAIEKEIIAIKKNEGFDDLRFFSIESSTEIGHGWQASIWVPLERDFRYKFVEVNDRDIGSFRELNKNKNYIFIICPNYSEKEKDKKCVDSFLVKYHNHTFFKNVYSKKTYRIDLIKKTL